MLRLLRSLVLLLLLLLSRIFMLVAVSEATCLLPCGHNENCNSVQSND